MIYSYEYLSFLREKIREHLPPTFRDVGGKYNGRCPFCGDSKKSMTKRRGWIFYNKDCSYYCFNCGISMSGIKLLKALTGNEYDDIHKEYVKLFLKSGLDSSLSAFVDEHAKEEVNVFNFKPVLKPEMKHELTNNAKEYLSKRKVLEAPFLKEKLFSLLPSNSSSSKEEFILIPWKINGIDAYYQINDFMHFKSMKYMFPKDKRKLLYGLDNVDPSYNKIFVFEGVYDSIFVKNGIASGTKSLTQYQLDIIQQRWPRHEVVVSFDNDESGCNAMAKMIENGKSIRFLKWFDESTSQKDINELVLAKGDVNLMSDSKKLDMMVVDPLAMKLWMMQAGKWHGKSKVKRSALNDDVPVLKRLSRL